jgi:hypothetical protein
MCTYIALACYVLICDDAIRKQLHHTLVPSNACRTDCTVAHQTARVALVTYEVLSVVLLSLLLLNAASDL